MLTCTKTYFDIPFAHRQYLHDWDISVTFACEKTDENGFVVDFGKVKFIKKWIDENLDHACVFSKADPLAERLIAAAPEAWNARFVQECSCEGLARHFFGIFNALVRENTAGRAWVVRVSVSEDKKNTACYGE